MARPTKKQRRWKSKKRGMWKKRKGEAVLLAPLGSKVFGFPNSLITRLRYCDTIVLTGTLGARALNVFAANGIFDPDITGVGHQPMYRDTFADIYDQYCVLGSKITVDFSPTTALVPTLVGIVGDDDSSITTSVQNLLEQNNGVSKLLGTPGSEAVTLTNTFSPLRMFGVNVKDDGSAATAIGANPSELWTFAVWSASADGASTTVINIRVEIEYTVKFSELQSHAGS